MHILFLQTVHRMGRHFSNTVNFVGEFYLLQYKLWQKLWKFPPKNFLCLGKGAVELKRKFYSVRIFIPSACSVWRLNGLIFLTHLLWYFLRGQQWYSSVRVLPFWLDCAVLFSGFCSRTPRYRMIWEGAVWLSLVLGIGAVLIDDPEDGGKHWVVIVAGSNGWYNYRHQVRKWLGFFSMILAFCKQSWTLLIGQTFFVF